MIKRELFFFTLFFPIFTLAQGWDMPRTPDGQPDMQGIWSNASQTPLSRPAEYGNKGFLTLEEAQAQMQGWQDRYDQSGQASLVIAKPPQTVIQIWDITVFGGTHEQMP